MSTIYEGLINELKLQLGLKKIKFKKMFRLINNQKYDEIVEIIHDEHIQALIDDIVTEREKIGNNLEKKLNDLIWLNERLLQFEEEPQLSKTQALKLLKTKVFINMYDLDAELYEKRTKKELLKTQLRKHPETRYPLYCAKENETLKCFLIKIK
jgi:hypothetical protein